MHRLPTPRFPRRPGDTSSQAAGLQKPKGPAKCEVDQASDSLPEVLRGHKVGVVAKGAKADGALSGSSTPSSSFRHSEASTGITPDGQIDLLPVAGDDADEQIPAINDKVAASLGPEVRSDTAASPLQGVSPSITNTTSARELRSFSVKKELFTQSNFTFQSDQGLKIDEADAAAIYRERLRQSRNSLRSTFKGRRGFRRGRDEVGPNSDLAGKGRTKQPNEVRERSVSGATTVLDKSRQTANRSARHSPIRVLCSLGYVVTFLAIVLLILPLNSSLMADKSPKPSLPAARGLPSLNATIAHRYAWKQTTCELQNKVDHMASALQRARGAFGEEADEDQRLRLLGTHFAKDAMSRVFSLSGMLIHDWVSEQDGALGGGTTTSLSFETDIPAIEEQDLPAWMDKTQDKVQTYVIGAALYWRSWLVAASKSSSMQSIRRSFFQLGIRFVDRIVMMHPAIQWSLRLARILDEHGTHFKISTSSASTPPSSRAASRLMRIPSTLRHIAFMKAEATHIAQLAHASSRLAGDASSSPSLDRVVGGAGELAAWCAKAREDLEGWTEGWLWLFLDRDKDKSLYRMMLEDEERVYEVLWRWWAAGGEDRRELVLWMQKVGDVVRAGVDALN